MFISPFLDIHIYNPNSSLEFPETNPTYSNATDAIIPSASVWQCSSSSTNYYTVSSLQYPRLASNPHRKKYFKITRHARTSSRSYHMMAPCMLIVHPLDKHVVPRFAHSSSTCWLLPSCPFNLPTWEMCVYLVAWHFALAWLLSPMPDYWIYMHYIIYKSIL